MNDSKEQQLASNTIRAKSDQPGEPLQPTIPATHRKRLYLGRLIVLILVAALAAFLPTRRATRVDPVIALRHE